MSRAEGADIGRVQCPHNFTDCGLRHLYGALSAHWGLAALQRGRPWMGPQMMRRFSEAVVAASVAAGFTPIEIARSHRELYVFTVGCALTHTTFGDGVSPSAIGSLDPVDFPSLSETGRISWTTGPITT